MPTDYKYELWNGKEVIGYYSTDSQIFGSFLKVPMISIFKQKYGKKYQCINIPLIHRLVSQDHQDMTWRIVLDVRKKSKRQIEFLKNRIGSGL